MKETICTIVGIVGSFIAGLFGGWDASMVIAVAMGMHAYSPGEMIRRHIKYGFLRSCYSRQG